MIRNEKVFKEVSSRMAAEGFQRTSEQCRAKLKKIKAHYRKVKDSNGRSGNGRSTWKWYDVVDAIYGHRPSNRGSEGGLYSHSRTFCATITSVRTFCATIASASSIATTITSVHYHSRNIYHVVDAQVTEDGDWKHGHSFCRVGKAITSASKILQTALQKSCTQQHTEVVLTPKRSPMLLYSLLVASFHSAIATLFLSGTQALKLVFLFCMAGRGLEQRYEKVSSDILK
uniref:Myb/SANT-like DNA-binding domain-containing protein n=2 Tax=Nothobranchius kuhntae TaxID=321403 RepID=A0A1A8IYD4_NOTKU